MRFSIRRLSVAGVAAGTLAIAIPGCGDAKAAGSTSLSSRSGVAKSALVQSTDGSFATVIPDGFSDVARAPRGGPVNNMLHAVVRPRVGNYLPSIDVVRQPKDGLSSTAFARRDLRSIPQLAPPPNAHGVSSPRTLTVAKAAARSISYFTQAMGRVLHQRQVFVLHGRWIYTLTYSALSTEYSRFVAAIDRVIASWRWTKPPARRSPHA
jgi:hypothetical protein